MKILAILNPVSGKKNINKNSDQFHRFKDRNLDIKFETTSLQINATEIINNQNIEPDILIISGGDGTISETVQGMYNMNFDGKILIIPTGTTNEIASNLNINSSFNENLSKISNPESINIKNIDYGVINNDITFVYSLSFGTFTSLTYKTPQRLKNIFGYLAYVIYGFISFRRIENHNITMKYEGTEINGNFTFGGVTNSKTIGGVIDLTEQSPKLDDGLFEIILIQTPKTAKQYRKILRSLRNKKYDDPMFIHIKTNELTIESNDQIDWNIDGEFGGSFKEIKIKNITKAIKVIV